MNYRPFGNTGFQVSEIGLGCWQLGGADWGDVPTSRRWRSSAPRPTRGVNFLDTADVYGGGRSEALIGRFLKRAAAGPDLRRHQARPVPEPAGRDNLHRGRPSAHTEASLKRLGVEALDLTQLHCIPTEQLRRGEVFEWLRTLQKEGKIRHFGRQRRVDGRGDASAWSRRASPSLQIIFNIFRQKPIDELFAEAQAQGRGAHRPAAAGQRPARRAR